MYKRTIPFIFAFIFTTPLFAQPVSVDLNLHRYEKTSSVSDSINSVGSDTMEELLQMWWNGFKKYYPNINLTEEAKGSATAPPALVSGRADIAPMSREMTNNEVNKFVKKYGYKPSRVSVGLDALEIFVNSKNPIQGLSLQQLDAIFSTTNKRGFKGNITVWGQVGLKSKWAFRKINLYGRNYSSGTNGYFKESTILNGEYKSKIVLLPTSDEMIKSISADLFGIGYSGIGYNNSGVKSIPLAEKDGAKYYRGTYKNVLNDNYPLSRFLYIYFNKKHGIQLDKLTHEFLKFILSYEGQKIVVKAGYFPLPVKNVVKELKKLE